MRRELAARLESLESVYRGLAPWILFRPEDSVLILPPNRVYKLGGSGAAVLDHLGRGGSLRAIPAMDEAKAADLERFFAELSAASAGRPVALERVAYDFDFTRLPILGELALTYRCNARCRFCYAGCGEAAAGNELSTAEAKRIIDLFKDVAKIPFFSFTGGEPLLRGDLEELAAHAVARGLRVNLITNGSLATPERAKRLKAAGIDTAQVSLESADPATHDALCGLEGAWRRTVAGIAALRAAGVSVQTNTTVTAANRAGLASLPAFLKGLGVSRFSMNLFIPSGRGLGEEGLFVPYSEIGRVVDAVRKTAHREGLDFLWYSPTPYCLYNPVARGLGNKSCAAADGLLHVNPRGDVLPCSSWPEPLGNLLERPFAEIWFSERAGRLKRKETAPAACSGCASFVACQGACPLYWSAVGVAELEGGLERPEARGTPCGKECAS
ncbi:MAG: radical SAM protein [Spirochaetaceae bacterium]|nr:radical SAM protein [Spirochaetaceae bacterium]